MCVEDVGHRSSVYWRLVHHSLEGASQTADAAAAVMHLVADAGQMNPQLESRGVCRCVLVVSHECIIPSVSSKVKPNPRIRSCPTLAT